MLRIANILASTDLEYESVAKLLLVCKEFREEFIHLKASSATVEFIQALKFGVVGIRYCPSFCFGPASFVCLGQGGVVHFDVRIEGIDKLRVYCGKRNYVSLLTEIKKVGDRFQGKMVYTNYSTGSILLMGFDVDSDFPWHIHGTPRNMEAALEDN